MDHFHMLRRLDYPEVSLAALQQLSHCLSQENASIPGLGGGGEELAEALVRDFIFFQGHGGKKLNGIQELQLLQMLMACIQQQPHTRERHQVFRALFNNKMNNYTMNILMKLVSMSICMKNKYVLQCAALWMKSQGVVSAVCVQMANAIVSDYCVLALSRVDSIIILPKIDRLFTCNLIAASCAAYKPDKPKNIRLMPELLVTTVANWLEDDPTLCLECVRAREKAKKSHAAVLFNEGEDSRTVVSPIPGLLMQCIAATMYRAVNRTTLTATDSQRTLYSKLMMGTIQSLLAFQQVYHDRYLELVSVKEAMEMKQLVVTAIKMADSNKVSDACSMYAQGLQVSLATSALRVTSEELNQLTTGLESNRLLEIIQRQHQQDQEAMEH